MSNVNKNIDKEIDKVKTSMKKIDKEFYSLWKDIVSGILIINILVMFPESILSSGLKSILVGAISGLLILLIWCLVRAKRYYDEGTLLIRQLELLVEIDAVAALSDAIIRYAADVQLNTVHDPNKFSSLCINEILRRRKEKEQNDQETS